jgi:hypothetical protein
MLAMLVIASTVSWTVAKHKCMGRVMDIALFVDADSCGMDAALGMLDGEDQENHCCDDESVTLKGQDDLKLSFSDFEFGQPFFAYKLPTYCPVFYANADQIQLPVTYHAPPGPKNHLFILHQVFLI